MMVCLEWYYLLLIANSLSSDPASHMSTGVHQEIGDCNVRAADLSGHMRQVYLCPESHSQVSSEISFIMQTRSDILQGQALFRGVKQLRRCLGMLNNFEKFSFPSIEKRWTKDKETDGQKENR